MGKFKTSVKNGYHTSSLHFAYRVSVQSKSIYVMLNIIHWKNDGIIS